MVVSFVSVRTAQTNPLGHDGGPQYLARLASSVVTLVNAGDYGRTIYDRFLRRQLIAISEDTADSAYSYDLDVPAGAQMPYQVV